MGEGPTPAQLQGTMLFVADPAYFGALNRGATRAEALREAVEAVMTACLAGRIPEHNTGDPIVMALSPEQEQDRGE